jgi:L-aspartate oxidase
LLEAVVYSHRAAAALPLELAQEGNLRVSVSPNGGPQTAVPLRAATPARPALTELRQQIRNLMWTDVGIVRRMEGLQRAAAGIDVIRGRIEADVRDTDPSGIELNNLAETAALIIACAQQRRESRGLHHDPDFPYRDNERFLHDTVLVAKRR